MALSTSLNEFYVLDTYVVLITPTPTRVSHFKCRENAFFIFYSFSVGFLVQIEFPWRNAWVNEANSTETNVHKNAMSRTRSGKDMLIHPWSKASCVEQLNNLYQAKIWFPFFYWAWTLYGEQVGNIHRLVGCWFQSIGTREYLFPAVYTPSL